MHYPDGGGLHDMWVGPQASTFQPKSIAVLPSLGGAYEDVRDVVPALLAEALKKTGRYDTVLDREQVNAALANPDAEAGLTTYFNTVAIMGQVDPAWAMAFGRVVHADAILIPTVNSWGYDRTEGDSFGRVGLELRLLDVVSGSVVWKGTHQITKNYMVFKPSLQDLAKELSLYMVTHMPQ